MTIDSLLAPKSVAMVGYSTNPDRWSHQVVANLINGGFEGRIYCVNPNITATDTLPDACVGVASLKDIDDQLDCVVVGVAKHRVLDAMKDAAAISAKAAIVPGIGFAELGPDGAELQEQMLVIANGAGLRVLGPNCFGAFGAAGSANVTPYSNLPAGHVGFISQSGNLALSALREFERTGLGFSALVGIGNQSDITAGELVSYFQEDPTTKSIAMYLEGMEAPLALSLIASIEQCVDAGKRVVVMKGGQAAGGVSAARSHTASMAGNAAVWSAALEAAGAICVDTIEEMCDVLQFADAQLAKQLRSFIIADGGGDAVLAADALGREGLPLAQLRPSTEAELGLLIPAGAPRVSGLNPLILDTAGGVDDDAMLVAHCASVVKASGDVDVVVVAGLVGDYGHQGERELELSNALGTLARDGLSVVVSTPHASDRLRPLDRLREVGIPVLPNVKRIAQAVTQLNKSETDIHAGRKEVPHSSLGTEDQFEGDVSIAVQQSVSVAELNEMLLNCGIDTQMTLVRGEEAAIASYKALGEKPVALKTADSKVAHKSEVGGVLLGLHGKGEIRDGVRTLVSRFGPEPLLVMPMLDGGMELLVSVSSDPVFGRYIVVGQGGVSTEFQADFQIVPQPITRAKVINAFAKLRIAPLAQGARGQEILDIESLVDLCLRLDQVAAKQPGIEIEMNPVILYPHGHGIADIRGSRAI